MAPARMEEPPVSWNSPLSQSQPYDGLPRNIATINAVKFDESLQPKDYKILGTHPESRILFSDVSILDSTGRLPYKGDVLIEGERIVAVGSVPNKAELEKDTKIRHFRGQGRTLMSGLGDAHAHLTWNGGDLNHLSELGLEEHVLITARSAKCFIDSGYTMAFGAASAKERLDVVIRDAINAGDIPGPRYLANGKEMARRDGTLVAGITAYADGPDEMREVIRYHIKLGVDNIKLSMSGEEITEIRHAQNCYFTVISVAISENALKWLTDSRQDEETAACVNEAHKHGKRLCAHARARDSVKLCVEHGVDVIYHASYIDDEGQAKSQTESNIEDELTAIGRLGMDKLEEKKTKHTVAPALNWLIATLHDAAAFGYPNSKAEEVGYGKELNAAIAGLSEMHRRGIVVLPGGDYGFAWTPHGTYARDLAHFKNLLGFTAHEAIIAATAGVAKLFMRPHELGKIQPGYFADCILVDGNPLEDIECLQDHDRLNIIVINGRVHKAGQEEYVAPPVAGEDGNTHPIVPNVNFPEVKKEMQKYY